MLSGQTLSSSSKISKEDLKSLWKAISLGNTQDALKLISVLPCINFCLSSGGKGNQSFLLLACEKGNVEIVEALLKKNANTQTMMSRGQRKFSCLDLAMDLPKGSDVAMSIPLFNPKDIPPPRVEIIRMLLEKDPTLCMLQNEHKETPLHKAASHPAFLPILELFVTLPIACNVNIANSSYNTPLHIAAASRNEAAVHLLLKAHADAKMKNIDGKKASDLCLGDPLAIVLRSREISLFEHVAKVIATHEALLKKMEDRTIVAETVFQSFVKVGERLQLMTKYENEIQEGLPEHINSQIETTQRTIAKLRIV